MKNFNFFYSSGLKLPSGNLEILYDFNQGTNPIVPQPLSDSAYLGTISSVGSFYSNPGSGHFQGQNVSISNSANLNGNNFSIFLLYEKPSGNGVLYSTLTNGGANVSGFAISVNDANRLCFECFDQNGPNIYTSSNIYGEKNAIAVVKSNTNLNFYYYNFNYQSVETERFTITPNAIYQSNQAYLGAAVNAPSYFSGNSYNGYMDQFVYINGALTSNVVNGLFSGFYSSGLGYTTGVVGYSNQLLTGASIQLNAVGTGITGFNVYLSGYAFDNCDNEYPIFLYNNLTGTIIEDTFVPFSGNVTYTITGLTYNGFYIDEGFCNSCGMDSINYLRSVGSPDQVEVYVYPFIDVTGVNLLGNYNSNGNFLMNSLGLNPVNVYDNGIYYYPGSSYMSGNGYVSGVYLSGNYYLTGQSIVSNGNFVSEDTVIYDNIQGISEQFISTNTGNESFSSSQTSNFVFLNGQKLVSGQDYNFAGGNLNLLNIVASGVINDAPTISGFLYESGRPNLGKFSRDSSMVWLNGQRQAIDEDYIEISSVDLLQNSGIFDFFPNLLYNNTRQFLEQW